MLAQTIFSFWKNEKGKCIYPIYQKKEKKDNKDNKDNKGNKGNKGNKDNNECIYPSNYENIGWKFNTGVTFFTQEKLFCFLVI
jgi:hypothetical protein